MSRPPDEYDAKVSGSLNYYVIFSFFAVKFSLKQVNLSVSYMLGCKKNTPSVFLIKKGVFLPIKIKKMIAEYVLTSVEEVLERLKSNKPNEWLNNDFDALHEAFPVNGGFVAMADLYDKIVF
jgi:hypothetical protein